jgi:hypothetical protein
MVGRKPLNWGRSQGGITVHTPLSNIDRIKRLRQRGFNNNEIALYRYPLLEMVPDMYSVYYLEQEQWIAAGMDRNNLIDSTVTPANPLRTYDNDLNGGGVGPLIRALIISASPPFLGSLTNPDGTSNGASIVAAANTWVTAPGTDRYVIYPLREFRDAIAPGQATANSKIIGPRLSNELRRLARYAWDYVNQARRQRRDDYDDAKDQDA